MRNRKGRVRARAIVDVDLYDQLFSHRWSLSSSGNPVRIERIDGKDTSIYMRQEVAGTVGRKGFWVQNLNGNPLDCRRTNLRVRERYKHDERWRETNLRRNYGIGLAEYREMAASQEEACLICGWVPIKTRDYEGSGRVPARERMLMVDHCHKTGMVRGLLCWSCNTALGHVKDDPAMLRKAAEYLEGAK